MLLSTLCLEIKFISLLLTELEIILKGEGVIKNLKYGNDFPMLNNLGFTIAYKLLLLFTIKRI